MGRNLLEFADWVEMETFFSAYLLLFLVIYFFATKRVSLAIAKSRLLSSLPRAYALLGTFYLGLQVMNLYPDFHFYIVISESRFIYLKIWGLLAVVFWFPYFSRKIFISLLHSVVFFILMLISFSTQLFSSGTDSNMITNNIKIYTASILLNLVAFTVISLLRLGYSKIYSRGNV